MIRIGKDPLSPVQRRVLANLVSRGGQVPAYDLRVSPTTVATQVTRRALARAGYIELKAVIPFRNGNGSTVKLDAAQITQDGLDALNWPTGDGSYRAHMVEFAEAEAYAEYEARHPAKRDFSQEITIADPEIGRVRIRNSGPDVLVDFGYALVRMGQLTDAEVTGLIGALTLVQSAARTHHINPGGTS